MIPKRLEITNFLSYREPVSLDFDGVHLACVSGLNGAGKSSLLDAMTWALFGRSRTRSDDDLVNRIAARKGEGAEVRLVFELEKIDYRVVRQKQVGRTTVLEFQMATPDSGWRSLSDGGVRQTQAAIEELLRMSFDTFINASFFLQGQADEFTTKTPGKRKEILAELLSVNLWDRYKEAAAQRRRQEEESLMILDARLREIDAELAEEEERVADVESARAALVQINERLAVKEALLAEKRRVESAVKQQQQQVRNLHEALVRAEAQLQRLRDREAERRRQREQHQALLDEKEAISAAYAAWQEADGRAAFWQEKADAYYQLQQAREPHVATLETARGRLQQQLQELEKQRERAARMRDEKVQVAARLEEAQQETSRLQKELAALSAQEEALHTARGALQSLQTERTLWEQSLAKLQQEETRLTGLVAEKEAVSANLKEAEVALEEAQAKADSLVEKQNRHAIALAERKALQQEQEGLRQEMDELHDRIDRLQGETGGTCPLCGQPLSDAHRAQVLEDTQAKGEAKARRFRDNQKAIKQLDDEISSLVLDVKGGDRWRRDVETQQKRQATAAARLEEIERALAAWQEAGPEQITALQQKLADKTKLEAAEKEVETLRTAVAGKQELAAAQQAAQRERSAAEARLEEITRTVTIWEEEGAEALARTQQRLAQGEIAPEAQAALASLDEQIAALAYDEAAHAAARAAKQDLADAPERQQALQQAKAAVAPLEETLADLAQQIGEQEETVTRTQAQHEEAKTHLETLSSDSVDIRAVEDEVQTLREAAVSANRRVGAAQQRLDVLQALRRQREEEEARRAQLTRRIERLQRLEKACGRDGVQALLIEQALPEIEEDANDLLERLTGGEMRVTFETQRELKSRDALAETLDIKISDTAGERPYENYSGGEQFRVNFAIRLALSRILAKRAGARLQTLVIDEGFGSQDPAGRQRLVEAINVIQEDFRRILVITHIDELRDAFPTRIEVEKTARGSQVVVT